MNMPNQDPSGDSKTSSTSGGFRTLFSKLFSKNSEHDAPSQETSASGERRAYVPRHANRDMLLAIPVEQRPDLLAKANESERRSAMAEIGFSTAGQSMHSQRVHRENASPRRHSLASSPRRSFDHRPSMNRSSSQRHSAATSGLGRATRRTSSVDAGTSLRRIEHPDSASPGNGASYVGAEDGSDSNGTTGGGNPRETTSQRRTAYFSHTAGRAGRGHSASKGKGRATEEEIQAAMLRDRAMARTMRNPGLATQTLPPSSSTHTVSSKTFGKWPRAKSSVSVATGQSLEQLREEDQSNRPISSIDGSVSTSNANSMYSVADTEASTLATTITETDEHSERGREGSESGK